MSDDCNPHGIERPDAKLADTERKLGRYRDAVAEVREIHEADEFPLSDAAFGDRMGATCTHCSSSDVTVPFPCPTMSALMAVTS